MTLPVPEKLFAADKNLKIPMRLLQMVPQRNHKYRVTLTFTALQRCLYPETNIYFDDTTKRFKGLTQEPAISVWQRRDLAKR